MGKGRLLRGAGAAVISQGIVAGSSLVLQFLSLRELGAEGLGIYSILATGIMVTATALHTGWVGDPLVLLDRFAPPMRRVLMKVNGIASILALLGGTLAAMFFAHVDMGTAVLFGGTLVLWLLEESGRRLLMARLEFAKLAVNDAAYAVVALGMVGAITLGGNLSLRWILASMAAGSAAAIATAVVQLPREELARPEPGFTDWVTLRELSLWRSGQLMMRPFGMLLVRWSVSMIVSVAALGVMESGRLLIAPILTVANGFGGFTLPFYTRRRNARTLGIGLIARFTLMSAALGAVYIPVALLLRGPFEQLGDNESIPFALALCWAIYGVIYASNIPIVNAMTALLYSRKVFVGRVIDSAFTVAASVILVLIDGVRFVPLVMAVGIIVGTAWPVSRLYLDGALENPGSIRASNEPAPGDAPATA